MAQHNPRGPWGDPERLKRVQVRGRFTHRPAPLCSQCGKVLDVWYALEPGNSPKPSTPNERQISICIECGTVHEFVGHPKRLQLKRLEGEELILALAARPVIKKVRGDILMDRALRSAPRACTH
jgi:hypothetical protein